MSSINDWARCPTFFADCAELAAAQAADPQSDYLADFAIACDERLAAGSRPEAELRDLVGFVLAEADPARGSYREPLFEVLDQGSPLTFDFGRCAPFDATTFIVSVQRLATAFYHGCGTEARRAMIDLCVFIPDGVR